MDKAKNIDGEQPLMQPVTYTKDAEAGHAVSVRQPQSASSEEFVGLTKEQLERYATDPFWRNLRWVLFILFWLAWIAMFVAAIVIVVMSPKCPEKQVRHWWQKKVSYQMYTPSFKDSDGDGMGDFKGIEDSIGDLKRVRVQTIWPYPVAQSADGSGYAAADFEQVDSRLGTVDDFASMVDKAHSKDMYVVMDFVPSVTSDQHAWFASATQDGAGSEEEKYHWRASRDGLDEKRWAEGGNSRAGSYYLHWPGLPQRPVLNLKNIKVMEAVEKSLKFWLSKGVDGFYVFSRFLGVDADGETDWDATKEVLRSLRRATNAHKNETESDKEILLFTSLSTEDVSDPGTVETLKVSLVEEAELNYVINAELAQQDVADGASLHEELTKQLERHRSYNETWPMWEVGNPTVSRVSTRFGSVDHGELLTMLLLALPGSINTYYGDEIGMQDVPAESITSLSPAENYVMRSPMQWDDSANAGFSTADPAKLAIPVHENYTSVNFAALYGTSTSRLRLYKRLAGVRQREETFLFGTVELGNKTDDVLILIRRPETIGMNYVAVLNFGKDEVTVDLTQPPVSAPGTAGVVEMTTNLDERGVFGIRDMIAVTELKLQGVEGIVVKFKTIA